ncbi:MAG: SDR family oxidoreductase [Bacteroidales bacterium]|nr:SDR family oxidoreductase [Bacteroidales bacterium]MCF8402522.1 SDR family oxidoreductase [Bacteroidales bacterium]
MHNKLKNSKILITGGAGFIGSNLIEYFLKNNNEVICLDNLSTGHKKNISEFISNPNFQFVEGDIRDMAACKKAVQGCEYVFHQAALGSVPRSIKDPVTTNAVNIDGFLNMLTVSRDEQVKRFIYAASSSTYGDSEELPKVEEFIGRPLSPYAITKVVNEYFAKVYSELYGMETIGLRYFNVFGKRQDPNGAYAAVIPLWVKKLIHHEPPVINGDGSFSRDFTYIDNVIMANELAALIPGEVVLSKVSEYYAQKSEEFKKHLPSRSLKPKVVFEVFNVAYGGNTTLNELYDALRSNLERFDDKLGKIDAIHGPERMGDIPHSLASVDKAKYVLGYNPPFDAKRGFEIACEWYYNNLK